MADPTDEFVIEHPVSIRHKVYDYLRNEILSNRISAGSYFGNGESGRVFSKGRLSG
jgi:DNA-binding GntR family transcriptional regulator